MGQDVNATLVATGDFEAINAGVEMFRRRFAGARSYGTYREAIDDPSVDAVVVAVPPNLHRDLALDALSAGKHVDVGGATGNMLAAIVSRHPGVRGVLFDRPHAAPAARWRDWDEYLADYDAVREARERARRVVLVGENDHYKPLAVALRRLIASGAIGEMVFAHFTTIAQRFKTADDWRNDEAVAGGDLSVEVAARAALRATGSP